MVRFVLRKDRDAQRPLVDDDDEDGDGDNKHNHRQRLDGQKMAHAPRTVCWIQRHTHTHTHTLALCLAVTRTSNAYTLRNPRTFEMRLKVVLPVFLVCI